MGHDVVVAVFARAPVLGRVKTRLAKDVGDVVALQAHRDLLERTLAAVESWPTELWLAGDAAALTSLPAELVVRQQPAGDLGDRMLAAVASIVGRGVWAIVIGSDCPVMSAVYIASAVDALADENDVVFGPAEDGGYALVAMRNVHPQLFEGINWSTPQVLDQSLARAAALDLRVAILDTVWDVDSVADWRRWRHLRSTDGR